MDGRAAVAHRAGKLLSIETVQLEGPKADEFTLSGADPERLFPAILGHEGAGVVVEVGPPGSQAPLKVRPAALGWSPEIPRGSRPFARDVARRVTGRDPLSQGTRPERAIFSVGRFRGHTTPIDGWGIAR